LKQITKQVYFVIRTHFTPNEYLFQYPHAVGKNTVLIAALQARNNARVVFSGSLYFFSDAAFTSPVQKASVSSFVSLFSYSCELRYRLDFNFTRFHFQDKKKYDVSGNEQVATAISKWVFHESGVLRVSSIAHHKAGEKEAPASYTIMEDVVSSANKIFCFLQST